MERRRTDLEIREATGPEEVARAAALLSSPGVEELARVQEDEPGCVRLLFRDGEPAGAIVHRRETWDFGEAELQVARVWECSGEVGESAFRHSGEREEFDALVEDWCEYLVDAGYHLAYVHGELALWPVHGFYPCFYHPRVYIPTGKALRLKTVYQVRPMMTRDASAVARLLDRNRHLRPRVSATGVPNFHHFVVEGPRRRVFGCFSMAVTDGQRQPAVFIPEVEVEDREAAETILAHAAPYAEEKGMRAIHFSLASEHPFAAACLDLGGYHQLRGTTRDITLDEEMVRIADIPGHLTALLPELNRRLQETNGASEPREFVISVEGEKVALRLDRKTCRIVEVDDDAPVIRLPRWAFTQIATGYRAPRDLRRGVVRPLGGSALLSALFPKLWPLSLCDHDLWDTSLRDPDKYSDAALGEIRKLRYPF